MIRTYIDILIENFIIVGNKLQSENNIPTIVHGEKQFIEHIRTKLIWKGFRGENIHLAQVDKAGNVGDYVAMI